MKKIEDIIGMSCIKCNNKPTSDKLKDIHYKINDALFKYSKKYAFKYYLNSLQNELIPLFKQLTDLDVANSFLPKKNEILQVGRDIIKKIRAQIKLNDMSNLNKAITESLNYNMYQYVKSKDNLNNMSIQSVLDILDSNKNLLLAIKDYINDDTVNTDISDVVKSKIDNLSKLQSQLVEYLNKRLNNDYIIS
jgi:hypothetical protein